MTTPYYQTRGAGHLSDHPPHGPAWKRMHHSPFFWLSAFCIMVAMYIFVTSNNLSVAPGTAVPAPLPALMP